MPFNLNEMFQTIIESLLEERIGLSAEAIGSDTITKAIYRRMAACGLSEKDDLGQSAYLASLNTSSEEWEKLVETVVVPETWFFRNTESFSFLGGYVRFEWLPQNLDQVLRVLSIPCSTGEEAYSVAMTLMDMSLSEAVSPDQFRIDAVDISEHSLRKAKAGVYGRESFRGEELSFRERYFEQLADARESDAEQFRIRKSVRKMVNFVNGNLLDPQLLAKETKPYDIIFCRNLFIYLSESARARAIQVIDRLLSPNGLLFVGHVERPLVSGHSKKIPFVWIRQSGVFACRRTGASQISPDPRFRDLWQHPSASPDSKAVLSKTQEIRQPPDANMPSSPVRHKPEPVYPQNAKPSVTTRPISEISAALFRKSEFPESFSTNTDSRRSDVEALLDAAQDLANQGRLNEALERCEKYLSEAPFRVQPYFLMGVIHNALGDEDQAEECFNKVVYLDPNHHEALSHLAFIMERRGQQEKALHLRQRAQRILEREESD